MPTTITARRGSFVRVSVRIKDWSEELLETLDQAQPGTGGKTRAVRANFHSTTTGIPAWSQDLFAAQRIEREDQTFTWTVCIPRSAQDFRAGTYAIRVNYVAQSGTPASPFSRIFDDTLIDIQ